MQNSWILQTDEISLITRISKALASSNNPDMNSENLACHSILLFCWLVSIRLAGFNAPEQSWPCVHLLTSFKMRNDFKFGRFIDTGLFLFFLQICLCWAPGQHNFVQLGSFLWNVPMLRLSARTFLLVFLVVDGVNLPGDLASGKLHHAHEYILGSTSHHLLVHSANWTQENWKLICL